MIEYLPKNRAPLLRGPAHPCPYLPDRIAVMQYALADHLLRPDPSGHGAIAADVPVIPTPDAAPAESRLRSISPEHAAPANPFSRLYRHLMDQRFRRSGDVIYRPACPTCQACVPIRIPVAQFQPSRSQRRVLARNRNVHVSVAPLTADDEHYDLYARYQLEIHDGQMLGSRVDFEHFVGRSPIESFELQFRLADPIADRASSRCSEPQPVGDHASNGSGQPLPETGPPPQAPQGQLVGVSVLDAFPDALSSVYFYYDPDHARRRLGVFSGLCEIEECRRRGLAYWYLGYHVAGCGKMEYKAQFRPHELLDAHGHWRSPSFT